MLLCFSDVMNFKNPDTYMIYGILKTELECCYTYIVDSHLNIIRIKRGPYDQVFVAVAVQVYQAARNPEILTN